VADARKDEQHNTSGSVLAGRSNLALRIASALVLAPLALITAYFGGWPFALLWAIAAALVLYEWAALVTARFRNWGPGQVAWLAAGIVYSAGLFLATIGLRADAQFGFAAILFLFALVWATDIFAYFAGRALGGPKLMPRVSPKKTWSGAIGGTVLGVAAALLVAAAFGIGNLVAVGVVAVVLSAISQAGDLFESAIKRQFDVKDSSSLIPGHGGLMDRLDGYAAAVIAAALIGVARGGLDGPARGLLVW
jgi:phosphatidate cytidylyltransferase